MPRAKADFDDLRRFEFREPSEVLDPDRMYTVYEIARLLQGVNADEELDAETEAILLDWAIPWMLDHEEALCFAEPTDDAEPGYYGLRTDGRPGDSDQSDGEDDRTDEGDQSGGDSDS